MKDIIVISFEVLPFGLERWMGSQPLGSLGGGPFRSISGAPVQVILTQLFWNLVIWTMKSERKIITALDDVSFMIKCGKFVVYAGPNGTEKSTMMKLLSGILQPASGDVFTLGLSPAHDRIRLMRRLGVLFDNRIELW